MTAKHTPGPWKVFEHSWCETSITAPDTPNAICGLDINHATEESQESDEAQMAANARLIAAAPDLLEALQEARYGLRWYMDRNQGQADGSDDEAMERIDAAIIKATGESS